MGADNRVNDEEWLREKYKQEYLSQSEIAELAGVSRSVVRNRMDWFDIEPRDSGGTGKPPEHRFWSRVNKDAPGDCWFWTGSTKNDYPEIVIGGETKYGHRYAYELQSGDSPGDHQVNHHCDNRICVNIDHLYLGTQSENVQDQVERGLMARGADKGNAKLTADEVREIRDKYDNGNYLQRELADEYEVTRGHIGIIVRRGVWAHIDD